MPEKEKPEIYLATIGAIITHDREEGKPLKDPYVVTWSEGVEGTITFSRRLWKEPYEPSIGDQVRLGGVHKRRIIINGKRSYGWRAESVEPVSPKSASQLQLPQVSGELEDSDGPVTLEKVLNIG